MGQPTSAPSVSATTIEPREVLAPARLSSVDVLRGLVMVIMAIDHARDYFSNVPFQPEDMVHTWPALFLTRWITHFCAPMFFFLAGTGAFLYRNKTGSVGKISKFLWTRGLWLVVLEWTVIDWGWAFNLFYFGGVIWSLGLSMVILAALVWLPESLILTFGLAMVGLHDLLDPIRPAAFGHWGWIWNILHFRGFIPAARFFVLFPLIPWVGVMAVGYAFGRVMLKSPPARQRMCLLLGAATTAAFAVLRGLNTYGNPPHGVAASSPGAWHPMSTFGMTLVSFLNVEKYPPSLQFLLMTIGPSLMLLAWFDRMDASSLFRKLTAPLLVFGRVPLFFYILHIWLLHALAVMASLALHTPVYWLFHGAFFMSRAPEGWGFALPGVYAFWLLAVVILYLPCRWFASLKARKKTWWLSYL